MFVLAHRGANRLAPENTLAAMVEALERGADGVELDVHCSADGHLVVRHDAVSPDGTLSDLTLAEIGRGLPDVPTLAVVLTACEGRLVNVEVKDPAPRAVEALVALLDARITPDARTVPDDVLVSSFHLRSVDLVRSIAPHLATGLLTVGLDPLQALATAVAGGHTAVHPDVGTLLRSDPVEVVRRAHDQGLQVNVWTVNDREQLLRLEGDGVDAVITDDEELYAFGVRGRRG